MTEMATEALPPEIAQKVSPTIDRDISRVVDYFAPTDRQWVTLPDGVQRVEIKVLTEGERRKYLSQTNSEVRMNQRTKDLTLKSNVGDDRKALLKVAITDWYVLRAGETLPFTDRNLDEALDKWPPVLIDEVQKEIQEINPWLLGTEDDLESMLEERDELEKRIEAIRERATKS